VGGGRLVPLCVDCSKGYAAAPDGVFYVCSALNCPDRPEFMTLVKNGDVGMLLLCPRHFHSIRSSGEPVVVVSRRLELTSVEITKQGLQKIHRRLH